MDEGRHVEVFHAYPTQKLEKKYELNDNLYVVIDALMTDSRWDMKFLGVQIMIEGLALGAFGMIQQKTQEPLIKTMLTYVITDEARHVHYGVLALREFIAQLSEKERREREDWAFEVSLFLRSRFFAHEFYGQAMSRAEWDKLVLESEMMAMFRKTMFKRVLPNLKRIGLLSDRIRPKCAELGLLQYEHGKAAPELTAADLVDDRDGRPYGSSASQDGTIVFLNTIAAIPMTTTSRTLSARDQRLVSADGLGIRSQGKRSRACQANACLRLMAITATQSVTRASA